MKLIDLCKKRVSTRDYSHREVPLEAIDEILEAARLAPSAVNLQPWHFTVVMNPELLDSVKECYPREWFKSAPLAIIVSSNKAEAWVRSSDGKSHADIDAAIAAEHICLAATDLNLGSCWVCNFEKDKLIEVLDLNEQLEPIVIIPIGYPKEPLKIETEKKRKQRDSIISWK
ncbi:MAG: nitroreductase family protein [Bacteroidales bacterium]